MLENDYCTGIRPQVPSNQEYEYSEVFSVCSLARVDLLYDWYITLAKPSMVDLFCKPLLVT